MGKQSFDRAKVILWMCVYILPVLILTVILFLHFALAWDYGNIPAKVPTNELPRTELPKVKVYS